MNDEFYLNCMNEGVSPTHVAEVGVFYPESSNILGFIREGIRTTLVEPDPLCVEKIRAFMTPFNNVRIFPNAVYYKDEDISLFRTNASTFVSGLSKSPALVNDKYKPREEDRFTVKGVTFDKIDDGSIDLLSIDTEGCEWYVIQNMVSRPNLLSIETHGRKYVNPFINEINEWIDKNGYKVWYKTASDTVYIKNDLNFSPPVFTEKEKKRTFKDFLRKMF